MGFENDWVKIVESSDSSLNFRAHSNSVALVLRDFILERCVGIEVKIQSEASMSTDAPLFKPISDEDEGGSSLTDEELKQ